MATGRLKKADQIGGPHSLPDPVCPKPWEQKILFSAKSRCDLDGHGMPAGERGVCTQPASQLILDVPVWTKTDAGLGCRLIFQRWD